MTEEQDGSKRTKPERPPIRRLVGIGVVFVGTLILVVGGFAIPTKDIPQQQQTEHVLELSQAPVAALIAVLSGILVMILGTLMIRSTAPADDIREIENIRQERSRLEEKIAGEARPDVLNTARLSLNDLERYHAINQLQARRSFNVGVAAFLIGFTAILAGILFYYLRPSGGVQIAAVSTIGGALGSFISGSCFLLYRRAMTQADYFYSNLIQAQDTMIAVRLCDEIQDPQARSEAIRSLIKTLAGRPRPAAGLAPSLNGLQPARRSVQGRHRTKHTGPANERLRQ